MMICGSKGQLNKNVEEVAERERAIWKGNDDDGRGESRPFESIERVSQMR